MTKNHVLICAPDSCQYGSGAEVDLCGGLRWRKLKDRCGRYAAFGLQAQQDTAYRRVAAGVALQLPIFFGEFETEQDICKPYQSSPDNDIARRRIIGSGQIATQLGKFDGITCKGFGG